MVGKDTWLREYISLFSRKGIKRWLILTIVALGLFYLMGGSGEWYSSLSSIMSIAVIIGWLLSSGFPFVIGSSLILCSDQTRNKIVEKATTDEGIRFSYLFAAFLILNLSVMSLIVFIGLVIGIGTSGYLGLIVMLPQLLGITLGISLLLIPIYTLIAIEFDNMKKSIGIGFFLSIALNFATGFPRFPVSYPEVALFGPAHLLSALLFVTIGGYGTYAVEYYVGLLFQLTDLITPILIWSVVAIASYYIGNKIFVNNLSRWKRERDGWLASEKVADELDDSELPGNLIAIRGELKQRQRYGIIIAIATMIVISMGGIGYVQVRQGEWTQVVYESPSGGESIAIGDWLYGSFTGVESPPSLTLGITCQGRILNWAGGTGPVYFTFEHREMTLSEFLALNETEFNDLFSYSESGNLASTGSFSGGLSGPIHETEYVWVLRFNDINGRTSGLVDVWFQVILKAF